MSSKSKAPGTVTHTTTQSQVEIRQTRSGPIPDPNELAEYNQVLPGLAERIIVMAENQSRHRLKEIYTTIVKEMKIRYIA